MRLPVQIQNVKPFKFHDSIHVQSNVLLWILHIYRVESMSKVISKQILFFAFTILFFSLLKEHIAFRRASSISRKVLFGYIRGKALNFELLPYGYDYDAEAILKADKRFRGSGVMVCNLCSLLACFLFLMSRSRTS